jgi:hypothetical protein
VRVDVRPDVGDPGEGLRKARRPHGRRTRCAASAAATIDRGPVFSGHRCAPIAYAAVGALATLADMTTPPTRRRPETLIALGVAFIAFGAMLQLVLTDYPGWGFIAGGALVAVVGIAWSLSRRRPANGPTDDIP